MRAGLVIWAVLALEHAVFPTEAEAVRAALEELFPP